MKEQPVPIVQSCPETAGCRPFRSQIQRTAPGFARRVEDACTRNKQEENETVFFLLSV
jgi:hypothetical protein